MSDEMPKVNGLVLVPGMEPSSDTITVPRKPTAQEVNAARQQHVQRRFQEFVQTLAEELGEPPLGAICIMHWAASVTVGTAITNMAPQAIMNVLDRIQESVPNVIRSIKAQIQKTKNLTQP